MEEPTNAVLAEQIKGLREIVEVRLTSIDSHLEALNGQVAKNSKFRLQGRVIFGPAVSKF